MTSDMMILYMKWFRSVINIDGVVVYFFDRHKSHMSLELAKYCSENAIIAIGLYANATRIIQPLDVGFFGGLKTYFKTLMDRWARLPENEGRSFELADLAAVIKEANDKVATPEAVQNAFRKCGIYPWNADNIDFSRCLGKNIPLVQPTALADITNTNIDSTNINIPSTSAPIQIANDISSSAGNGALFLLLQELKQQNADILERLPLTEHQSQTVHGSPSYESPLKVPEKPSRKGGRIIKALPSVVSGPQYIKMLEDIEQGKREEESRKQQRRDDVAEKKVEAKKLSDEKKKERLNKIKIKQEKNEERKAEKRKSAAIKLMGTDNEVSLPKRKPGRPKKSNTLGVA